jgi:plastocyanin
MHRMTSALGACAALALIVGCGSSNRSTGSSSSASSSTVTAPPASLKPITTPKYAAPAPSAPIRSGVVQIAYRNITIAPDTLRVKVGSTLRWTNYDSIEHNVSSQGGPQTFASQNFGEGKTFQIKLTKPGLIRYVCTIHPASMNGSIEVVN